MGPLATDQLHDQANQNAADKKSRPLEAHWPPGVILLVMHESINLLQAIEETNWGHWRKSILFI